MKKTGSINRIVYSKTSRILLFFFLGVFITLSLWFYHELNQSQMKRYLSYIVADELRQSSDDLTRMVRTYVMTNDPRYEEMYRDILAIRNGQKARPIRYENIYWDFMTPANEKPRPDGQKISLLEMMKDLGFTQEELAKLAQAETYSNDLVRIEEIALHAMKGEFLDAEGEFTVKREPDYSYARAILYDESYHKAKVDIMTPIDDVFVMINTRTEEKVSRDTICTYIPVAAAFVTILLLLCMSRVELNERKQAEQQLLENQAQLKSLASELVLAEERERNRIAVHLHDEVSQSLAFAKMKLQVVNAALDDHALIKDMTEVCDTLTRMMQEVHSLTFELSTPVLTELGLEKAISHWLQEQVEQKHAIDTGFSDDGQLKPLDDDIRFLLFRSVRELLVNVAKHSKAKQVRINISRDKDQILIHLEDDGIGFAPDKVIVGKDQGGFGLFSIRERLSHLGGSLEIDSSPGQGCRSILKAPLQQS